MDQPVNTNDNSNPSTLADPLSNGFNLSPTIPSNRIEIERQWHVIRSRPEVTQAQFRIYQKLPTELRQAIWQIAASEPRVVNIIKDEGTSLKSDTLVPAILHACKESRENGLNIYEKIGTTYIRWSSDTVMFQFSGALVRFLRKWHVESVREPPRDISLHPKIFTQLNENTRSLFLSTASFHVLHSGKFQTKIHFHRLEEILNGTGMVWTADGGNITLEHTAPPPPPGEYRKRELNLFQPKSSSLKTIAYVIARVDDRKLLRVVEAERGATEPIDYRRGR